MAVNGSRAKAHREIRAGDRVTVTLRREPARAPVGLAERSIPKAQARQLYEDVTPPVPPEVAEACRPTPAAPRDDMAGRTRERATGEDYRKGL